MDYVKIKLTEEDLNTLLAVLKEDDSTASTHLHRRLESVLAWFIYTGAKYIKKRGHRDRYFEVI
jgi:hypothetical protein